jgi:hypothetical protein
MYPRDTPKGRTRKHHMMLFTETPTEAALACARRFREIEELHGANHKGRWAMFNAALKRYKVDEFEVEAALEWLDENTDEL